MPSVYTLTFSPCIDKSTSVPALQPEKKLRCSSPVLEPGGGGINVARALKHLGHLATAVFPSGGYTGQHFNQLLREENIPSRIIPTISETRENIIVYDESSGQQYRFGMPGSPLTDMEWRACLQTLEEAPALDFIVASGSLPPGVPDDVFARLSVIARKKSAKLIVDTSGEALRHAVDEGLYMIKPNLGELSKLAGREELHAGDVVNIARSIIGKGRIELALVSMGAAGAMLVTRAEACILTPPPVIRKSTVGAGDSMVAGMIAGLLQFADPILAARYAVACGTAATLNPGTQLCRKTDADRLYSQVMVANM